MAEILKVTELGSIYKGEPDSSRVQEELAETPLVINGHQDRRTWLEDRLSTTSQEVERTQNPYGWLAMVEAERELEEMGEVVSRDWSLKTIAQAALLTAK